MNKIALIGDIVSSKAITQRGKLQEQLSNILKKLNKQNPNLTSLYTLTLGDEFQAVFNNANSLFYEVIEILSAVYPAKIRFSLGVGRILTPINHHQALGMDGPAFHYARQGIEELKSSSCLFNIAGLEYSNLNLLNKSLCLFSHSIKNWTHNRYQTLALIYQKNSVQEIARKLKVSERSVYKHITDGNLRTVHELLEEITHIIDERVG